MKRATRSMRNRTELMFQVVSVRGIFGELLRPYTGRKSGVARIPVILRCPRVARASKDSPRPDAAALRGSPQARLAPPGDGLLRHLDVRVLDHLGPAGDLVGHKGPEFIRRVTDRDDALFGKSRLHGGVGGGFFWGPGHAGPTLPLGHR